MPIGSLLAKGIKNLPEEFVTKADSLPNVLKKAGIKQEELDFSKIDLPTSGKVTKADLVKAEAGRKDFFEIEQGSKDYQSYSLPKGKANPTYREKVTTFKDGGQYQGLDNPQSRQALTEAKELLDGLEEIDANELVKANFSDPEGIMGLLKDGHTVDEVFQIAGGSGKNEASRYTSSHFPETPNYLMHSRVYDDNFDGTPTRVVQEIQSDLHQAGRQQGYGANAERTELLQQLSTRIDESAAVEPGSTEYNRLSQSIEELASDLDLNPEMGIEDAVLQELSTGGGIPKSPFEKTWLRKGMEREINDALEEGMGQIAIPIKGAVEGLQRGEGVQKWYENVVATTAKKLAKSKNMDFEMVTKTTPGTEINAQGQYLISRFTHAVDSGDAELQDEVFEMVLEHVGGDAAAEIAQSSTPRATLIQKLSGVDEVTYAVIKPKSGQLEPAISEKAIQAVLDAPSTATKQQELMDLGMTRSEARGILLGTKTPKEVAEAEMKMKGAERPNFALYSTPIASVGAAATMLSEGYSQDEVSALLTEEGYDAEEVAEIFNKASAVSTMKAEGYTDEDIQPMLAQQDVSVAGSEATAASTLQPPTPGRISDAYRSLVGAEELSPKDLLAKMEITYPDMSAVTTNILGFLGDQEAARESEEAALAQRARIVDEMAKRGMQLRWDETEQDWIATTEEGEFVVTPEWYKSFWEAKGEVIGAIGGAAAGFKAGMALPIPHPVLKGAAGVLGALAGGAIGSIGGTELDYMHDAMILQQDFEGEVMARKAMTAAELSVIGDVVGAGAFKIAGKSWKGMVKAKDFIKKGFFDKANTALRETMFISAEEADELVTKLANVSNVPGKTQADKRIAAVAMTKPGAEDLVKAAAATDSTAGQAVAKAVSERADDILKSTADISDESIGRLLREDLDGYKTLVKDEFTRVKEAVAATPRVNNFKFDYDKLALDPVLQRLGKNIENPDLAFKFGRQAQKIRDMSKSRRLPDLLDLRKLVNEFRYNKRIASTKDFKMLDDIRGNIDEAIERGAEATMDNPSAWLKSWREANSSYSQMKELEKNTLAKVLTRPGVSEKAITQALLKYSGALDSTFVDVLAKLPKKTRAKVEGSVIHSLADKFAAGLEGGQRAIHFPLLAKELDGINFSSPDARSMKKALQELAEVFKNDVPLAQAAGGIQIPKFQSFLTVDPVMRAKFELATQAFNTVKSKAPTAQGRALTLVKKAAKVLENPTHSKSIQELREAAGDELNVDQYLAELMAGHARKQAAGEGTSRIKLFGDSKVLALKGKGTAHSVAPHRIADTDTVKRISEATGINLADKKALDMALKERGYVAAQLGADKVRLLEK